MQFLSRAKKYETETAYFRRWASQCGGYAALEIRSKLGLHTRFLALRVVAGQEQKISQHRSRATAQQACRNWDRLARSAEKRLNELLEA